MSADPTSTLPPPRQVAACAGQHIQAVKGPGPDGRVVSSFRPLEHTQERLYELADMMGLLPATQAQQQLQGEEVARAQQLAAQLLAAAQEGAAAASGSSSNGGGGGSSDSSSSSSAFVGLSAAAAAAGAASAAAAQQVGAADSSGQPSL